MQFPLAHRHANCNVAGPLHSGNRVQREIRGRRKRCWSAEKSESDFLYLAIRLKVASYSKFLSQVRFGLYEIVEKASQICGCRVIIFQSDRLRGSRSRNEGADLNARLAGSKSALVSCRSRCCRIIRFTTTEKSQFQNQNIEAINLVHCISISNYSESTQVRIEAHRPA